jgi:hypothetical protein
MNGAFPIVYPPGDSDGETQPEILLLASALHMFGHMVGNVCLNPYDPATVAKLGPLFIKAAQLYVEAAEETLAQEAAEQSGIALRITQAVRDHDHREHEDHDTYRWADDGGPHPTED